MIYSFDTTRHCAYLLDAPNTGARGATGITYIERENVICNQSGGMLFESEYASKPGCIRAFGSWGTIFDLDDGWEDEWDNLVYVFDENDSSKDVVESHVSDKAQEYLNKAKEFDLKYTKYEAEKAVYNLEKPVTISAAIKLMLPYFAIIFLTWLLLLIGWYIIGLPIGPGVFPTV